MSYTKKPVALAIGATLASGLLLSGSAFASTQLAQGYLLGGQEAAASADKAKDASCGADKKTGEASCGADKKKAEGKCGEGKCGMAVMDTDKDGKVSRAEFNAKHADAAEQAKFDGGDTNKDGFIDATEAKAHQEGKCGDKKKAEGACGADKKAAEKKAGEGKCGEGKCGGSV